ncbi:WbqC family protein [Lutibacter sp.]|uniref:WbqC family protein n=1 Tax=Lutibacter sp. TaxID=1925666 RepID=UPI002734AACA|nr:WbqC family protein [Lutibacter sp.]MDP3312927.1 WbqC family protein [Lutibacter sp.]
MVLLHPTYFSPIIQYIAIANCKEIKFEFEDNYQKQSYRNRCYIGTAQGKLQLNVPIKHTKGIKQKTKDVKIDYKDDWNNLHLKSLITAYNSAPFFEYYVDDLLPVFTKKFNFLLDLNLKTHEFVMDALQLEIQSSKTDEFFKESACLDLRKLAVAKSEEHFNLTSYYQVFNENIGFLQNLSILDLIFNEGPNALNYLETQQITF